MLSLIDIVNCQLSVLCMVQEQWLTTRKNCFSWSSAECRVHHGHTEGAGGAEHGGVEGSPDSHVAGQRHRGHQRKSPHRGTVTAAQCIMDAYSMLCNDLPPFPENFNVYYMCAHVSGVLWVLVSLSVLIPSQNVSLNWPDHQLFLCPAALW